MLLYIHFNLPNPENAIVRQVKVKIPFNNDSLFTIVFKDSAKELRGVNILYNYVEGSYAIAVDLGDRWFITVDVRYSYPIRTVSAWAELPSEYFEVF